MYSIPKDVDVILAIRNVLARFKAVRSQRELRQRVEGELNFGGGDYHVSEERVRRLAVISGVARLRVFTRATGKGGEISDCPVCGEPLRPERNMTVYGKEITTGHRCAKCDFRTETGNLRKPSRYEFALRRR